MTTHDRRSLEVFFLSQQLRLRQKLDRAVHRVARRLKDIKQDRRARLKLVYDQEDVCLGGHHAMGPRAKRLDQLDREEHK